MPNVGRGAGRAAAAGPPCFLNLLVKRHGRRRRAGHQIEHHLFPDLPSNRYAEVAPKVQEMCKRYGLTYTIGPIWKQVGSTWAKVFRLALPPRMA